MKNFFALLLFIAGMSGWYLYHQHTEALAGLAAAEHQLDELDKSTAVRRAEFKAASAVMTIKAKIQEKKAELKTAQDQVKALEAARQQVISEKSSVMTSLRQIYIGREVNLTLTTGRNLGQVRILKIEDSGLSVATTSGVVKVLPSELSKEIRDALFLN